MDDLSSSPATAVERVVQYLRSGILENRFPPGYRLIEADITRDLGVSRGPVREGLRRLSAEGLIKLVPNRSAMVRGLSLREASELFQIRVVLETLAAQLAAEKIGDPDRRKRFEQAIKPIWSEEPRLDLRTYTAENNRFHQAVLECADNEQLSSICAQLSMPFTQVVRDIKPDHLQNSVKDHRQIAKYILAESPKMAGERMQKHLDRARLLMSDLMKSDTPSFSFGQSTSSGRNGARVVNRGRG